MNNLLSQQFYQRYFSAVRSQGADWLVLVSEQARMEMLAHLTQWDMQTLTDKKSTAGTSIPVILEAASLLAAFTPPNHLPE